MKLESVNKTEEREEIEEKANPPWTPRIITGGKEEPPENWLAELPALTVFATTPKARGPEADKISKMPLCDVYQVVHQFKFITILHPMYQEQDRYLPVISLRFSRLMELLEVIEDGYSPAVE